MTLNLAEIPRLVLQGYTQFQWSRWCLVEIADWSKARAWLVDQRGFYRNATADDRRSGGHSLTIGFSYPGLAHIGLNDSVVQGLGRSFKLGAERRARAMGDTGDSDPTHWEWGCIEKGVPHAVVVHYAREQGELDGESGDLTTDSSGFRILYTIDAKLHERDHFGFRDGISQPYVEGVQSGRQYRAGALSDVVRAGEFVLGYPNESGQFRVSVTVPSERDAGGDLPRDQMQSDLRDFGLNGTYLVVRQLEQHVPEWNEFLDENAATTGADPAIARDLLAAKVVGRWKDGAPIVQTWDHGDPGLNDSNDFGYHASDRRGYRCPIGAHIRRANPRDSSADAAQRRQDALREANTHRLIRRSRSYEKGGQKGLLFACLCASIENQFEFVQQTWINNPSFAGLRDEDDPLVAGRGGRKDMRFTMQDPGQRREVTGLARFVTVRGGAYFFLPSVSALRFLANFR